MIVDEEVDFEFNFFDKWRPPTVKRVIDKNVEPLQAYVYEVSPTGNLTITFNKPIIVPKIVIYENRTIGFGERMLISDEEELDIKDYWNIEDVIELWVESDYYSEEEEEIRIYDFTLTEISSTTIKIKLNFNMPKKITHAVSKPDELIIKFKEAILFVDSKDFSSLS